MVRFKESSIKESWDDAIEMMVDNAIETGQAEARDNFHPSKDKYLALENAGVVRVFVARDDFDLIGYCVMFVLDHHHYEGVLWATQDVIYIKPKYRGLTSVKFIKWIDEKLLASDVMLISRSVTERLDYSRTLERMGYREIERVYMRGKVWG